MSPVAVAVSPVVVAVSPVAEAVSPVAVACSSSVHITCCCGLLLLWRCSNALCASGFVDDVLSSYLPMVQAVS